MATSSAVVFDFEELEKVVEGLASLDSKTLGAVALRVVNTVANRGFDTSRKQMLRGVSLTETYVKERMTVEEGSDVANPSAKIIAFRPGGERRPQTKPVNLRQYGARIEREFTNWRNDGTARNSGKKVFGVERGTTLRSGQAGPVNRGVMYENPRKPGSKLPFKQRIGNQLLGLPVGTKARAISVEVRSGHRKEIKPSRAGFKAFMQRMPNGQVLVMRRVTRTGGKGNKGKIESLHSLSVAQLFKSLKTRALIIPLIMKDLEESAVEAFEEEIQKAINL